MPYADVVLAQSFDCDARPTSIQPQPELWGRFVGVHSDHVEITHPGDTRELLKNWCEWFRDNKDRVVPDAL
jgi:hypothetical protein